MDEELRVPRRGTITSFSELDQIGRVLAELDGSNNVLSTFIYGLKPNVPDYMVRAGTAYRIVSDWRGDVRLVLDTTKTGTAAIVEQLDYDEWGNVISLVDPGCSVGGAALCWQPFGFAGGVFDITTGIVRFGARDYDPAMKRWTQKDRSRFQGGPNLYRYAKDDPINRIDRTGRLDGPITTMTIGAGLLAAPEGVGAAGLAVGAGATGAAAATAGFGAAVFYVGATAGPTSDEGPGEGGAPLCFGNNPPPPPPDDGGDDPEDPDGPEWCELAGEDVTTNDCVYDCPESGEIITSRTSWPGGLSPSGGFPANGVCAPWINL